MPDGWIEVPLGEVANFSAGKILSENERHATGCVPLMGANGRIGWTERVLYPHPVITVGRVGAFGAVHVTTGPSWVSDNALVAIPSIPQLLFSYLALTLEAVDYGAIRGGTTQPLITQTRLREVLVQLPPLADQRRIVDLIQAVDSQREGGRRVAGTLRNLLPVFLAERIDEVSGQPIELGQVLSVSAGGVWGEETGASEVDVDVYRSTEFTNDGLLKGTPPARRSVLARQLGNRLLKAGDILIEKSGGTPDRPVGRAVRVGAVGPAAVCGNFVHLVRVDPKVADPGYVFWLLWWMHKRGTAAIFQQSSTNIRNLRTRDYLAQQVPLPDRDTQRRVAAGADALQEAIERADFSIQTTQRLRDCLLSALLSGEQEIGASYDRLLEAVA